MMVFKNTLVFLKTKFILQHGNMYSPPANLHDGEKPVFDVDIYKKSLVLDLCSVIFLCALFFHVSLTFLECALRHTK